MARRSTSDGTSVRARMAVSRARERGEQMMWVMYFATSDFEASLAASLSETRVVEF